MTVRRSKKQDRLCVERNAAVKPIKKIYTKMMNDEMDGEHRIYYKKTKTMVEINCSITGKCEKRYRHETDDLFDMRKTMQQDPKHNEYGKCPICGRYGKFISPGKAKRKDIDTKYYMLYENWDGDGLLIRHIEVWRKYNNPYDDCNFGGCVQNYKNEVTEYARTYLKIGQEPQIDYHKYDYFSDKEFWDYKNLPGMGNIYTHDDARELNIQVIRNGVWKYAEELRLKILQEDLYKPYRQPYRSKFLGSYAAHPEMEMMYKLGMTELTLDLLRGYTVKTYKGRTIWEKYGVTKEHWNYMREQNLDSIKLLYFQWNDRNGYKCTNEQIEWIQQNLYKEIPAEIMNLSTPTKIINYIKRQTKEDGYRTTYEAYSHYEDYIHMMRNMGYDLSNTVYLFPKDLEKKHDEVTKRFNLYQDDIKKRKKNEEYPNIEKNFKKINKKYGYVKGNYFIRPAASAAEIIDEGRCLHHCVGGDNYLSKHNTGKTYILFMRKRKTPNTPYCTIEIKGNGILQWYEAHDKKPHKETIKPWLDEYVEHLKKEKEKKDGTVRIELAAG